MKYLIMIISPPLIIFPLNILLTILIARFGLGKIIYIIDILPVTILCIFFYKKFYIKSKQNTSPLSKNPKAIFTILILNVLFFVSAFYHERDFLIIIEHLIKLK